MNINWATPMIDIYLFVDYPPMNINCVDYPPMNINWATPTIDIILFVDYHPMNINWAIPTIDIYLFLDYPPIINIFRQPSEPFSLDSSQALTPIVLGCFSAYGMHVCQFQYSLIQR